MCYQIDKEIREQWIKEAKERIAKRKLEEGTCLTLDDIEHMTKEERIRLAKYMCGVEFK